MGPREDRPLSGHPLLFGHDDTPGLLAVEFDGEAMVTLYRRHAPPVQRPFRPFLLLTDPALLAGQTGSSTGAYEVRALAGEGDYRALVTVPTWSDLEHLLKALRRRCGISAGAVAAHAPWLYLNDPVHQYLLYTGQTLFKGMAFGDLVRFQLDIETLCSEGYHFPNPERTEDRVILIAMTDSTGWECALSGATLTEDVLLREMVATIRARDPDVIEGHNIFNFDLAYLETRARRHGVPLAVGREGRLLRSHRSRLQIAERTLAYTKYEIPGRHIVDTWFLAQLYDVVARNLDGYGLKDVARRLQVSPPNRTYLDPEKIPWTFAHEPETLAAYALDDVRETRGVSEVLSPGFFSQAQMLPYAYQNVIVRGQATKINALMLRAYLAAGQAVPRPPAPREFAGGYTEVFEQGVVGPVLYCDVQSLYPSIMLTFGYAPQTDRLGVFLALLKDLTALRLQAKAQRDQARVRDVKAEAAAAEILQAMLKVLINSFYGYLGFAHGQFSDVEQAERVAAQGRELLAGMVTWLTARSARPIEIDTDGIYFVPPPGVETPAQAETLIGELSRTLPEGITLELAGRYRAMFSYKAKNYALLSEDDRVVIKGSALKSRGLELFQRRFAGDLLGLALRAHKESQASIAPGLQRAVEALRTRYLDDLTQHRWDKKMFIKTETLSESPATYLEKVKAKTRNPTAAYELALRSRRPYQAGDQVAYYVTGQEPDVRVIEACKLASEWNPQEPDENIAYYRAKLLDLYARFVPLLAPSLHPGSL